MTNQRNPRIQFSPGREVPVRYRYFSKDPNFVSDTVFDGKIVDLNKTGCLFVGALPGNLWVGALGRPQTKIGLNFYFNDVFVKTLVKVLWIEPGLVTRFGVSFYQIQKEHQDMIQRCIIRQQLETRSFSPRRELLERDMTTLYGEPEDAPVDKYWQT